MRPRSGALAALCLPLAVGCGGGPTPASPATRSITAAQVEGLPLEEAGDLGIRQNLAERPQRPILGRDTPNPTASH